MGSEYGLVSFRVPAQRTSDSLLRLRDLAVRVPDETTQTEDVTEQYIDLQGRLSNLERTEEQYIRLLAQAQSVEAMLKVQRELSNVQGLIETNKGRIQYLERTSAMSLITVNLQLATSVEPLVLPGWSFPETVKDALRSLLVFGQWVGTATIWVIIYSPVWASVLAVSYLGVRGLFRYLRRAK